MFAWSMYLKSEAADGEQFAPPVDDSSMQQSEDPDEEQLQGIKLKIIKIYASPESNLIFDHSEEFKIN